MNKNITQEEIVEAARKFVNDYATLGELKGISREELEAVYSLGFTHYRTGRYEDASKLFQFLVLFDHLNPKYWLALGAVQQVAKDYKAAVSSYAYASFLDLENPKPQFHAAECFLALGEKENAASAIIALEQYCPKNTETGREYLAKAAALRKQIGEDAFSGEKPAAEA
ncbi:MAG: SycD/LcrH family type III secretion system chaperone [Kiritimatiellae bacterium]|nr:SycD/LcrH family type III secretion system chaperone [Kiritimatiellia bacterium]